MEGDVNSKEDIRMAYSRVSILWDSRSAFLFSSYVKKKEGNLINFHWALEDLETGKFVLQWPKKYESEW